MRKIAILLIVFLTSLSVLSGCAALGSAGDQAQDPQTTGTEDVPSAADGQADGGDAGRPDDGAGSDRPSGGPPEPADSEAPASDVLAAAVESDTYEYSSDYIDVSIVTPKVTGLPAAAGDAVNAVFSEYARLAKEDIGKYEKESIEMAAQDYMDLAYMIDVSYDVAYLGDGLLSLTLADFRYLGGAHGGTAILAYTFDLATGAQLTLGDLMSGDYKSFINGVIRAEIDRRVAEEELYELAEFQDIGDTTQWYPADDGIVFYFQEYEYFPYAAGIQTFSIPYSDLQPYLNERFASIFIAP